MKEKISLLINMIRDKNPLVHHITNYVTANDCANITLAAGASPVMADDINEVYDVVSGADSLVLNAGTLNEQRFEAMLKAGKRANELNIPVIFDPVGAGSSEFRTKCAIKIINEIRLTAVKGNFSEIKVLYGEKSKIKGVDSEEGITWQTEHISYKLAEKLDAVVAVSGETDIITNGREIYRVKNGSSLMSKVTGMGCMCSSLVGSCVGTGADSITAVSAGIVFMGISGEMAERRLDKNLEGTGSFKVKLIDAVYNLTPDIIYNMCKL